MNPVYHFHLMFSIAAIANQCQNRPGSSQAQEDGLLKIQPVEEIKVWNEDLHTPDKDF
jgi:hypothetical protein